MPTGSSSATKSPSSRPCPVSYGPRICQIARRAGRHPHDLVWRHLPGSEKLLRQHARWTRKRSSSSIQNSPSPPNQRTSGAKPATEPSSAGPWPIGFNGKSGTAVPLTSPIWGEPANQAAWEFEICGIFDTTKKSADTSNLYFRYDYFDEARPRGKGEVGWYIVRTKDSAAAEATAKKIDEQFANSPYETKAESEGAFAAGFAQQIGDIGTILIAVLSAVFFTILLVAGNTMSQSVRERTEEIGVLKALGFTGGLVLLLVLAESCVIALLGGLAGLGMAWGMLAAEQSRSPALFPVF